MGILGKFGWRRESRLESQRLVADQHGWSRILCPSELGADFQRLDDAHLRDIALLGWRQSQSVVDREHLTMERSVKESRIVSLKSLRAREARRELTQLLGGCCRLCRSTHQLEFDVIAGVGSAHHFMDWPSRIRFYFQQHLLANLQILCKPCHLRKTIMSNHKGKGFMLASTSGLISKPDAPRELSWEI
jgi:hypothetical protein